MDDPTTTRRLRVRLALTLRSPASGETMLQPGEYAVFDDGSTAQFFTTTPNEPCLGSLPSAEFHSLLMRRQVGYLSWK